MLRVSLAGLLLSAAVAHAQFNAGMFLKPAKTIVGDNTAGRSYTDGTYAISCNDYKTAGYYNGDTGTGVYWVKPSSTAFKVYCDMTNQGGGWTLIAKISGSDAVDRWGYDNVIYKDTTTLGDATNMTANDAKSDAYSSVAGNDIFITRLNGTAYAVHRYATTAISWGSYLTNNWSQCGYQISASATALVDDGRDSLIGSQLYLHMYDGYFPDCLSQERSMLSEFRMNSGGHNECGVGNLPSTSGVAYADALSYPAGSAALTANATASLEDYAFFVR